MRTMYQSRREGKPERVAVAFGLFGMTRLPAVLVLVFALALCLPFRASSADSENVRIAKALSNAYAEVVEMVAPAVVGIETEKIIRRRGGDDDRGFDMFERFFEQFPREFFGPRPRRAPQPDDTPRRSQGIGSGVVIDNEGHILTNNHVVADADTIKIEFANEKGKTYRATIVGRDPNSDLAVIKLTDRPAEMPRARLGDSDALMPGNIVIAIGSPFGFKQSVTQGVVSATGRNLNEFAFERFIQTDASINPGNSGGPLVNLDGEVVGLNTMISTAGGRGSIGIGFAIPINQAKSVIAQLIEKGSVTRGWLGIEMNQDDPEISRELGQADGTGVLIVNVTPESPAAKAGIRKGDLIISFDNIAIRDNEHLRYLVADTEPGREVPVVVLRDRARITINVNIQPQPEDLYARSRRGGMDRGGPDEGVGNDEVEEVSSSLGFTVRNLDDAIRQKYEISDRVTEGVVVIKVDETGEAAEKGIRPGTVIMEMDRLPVKDVAAFRAIMKDSAGKDRILINLRFGDISRYMLFNLK